VQNRPGFFFFTRRFVMKKYMLTRGNSKPCTHDGLRIVKKPGNIPDCTEHVSIRFDPMKITAVDDDIDMTPVIESGYIVEIKRPMVKNLAKKIAKEKYKEETPKEEPKKESEKEPKEEPKKESKGKSKGKAGKKKGHR